jgi:hypothetical protein
MTRERLSSRRGSLSFNFKHGSRLYHATVSRFDDGRVAEIFLDADKIGSDVQQHASSAAVLASIAMQHGVAVETIIHAVKGGPLAAALELAVQP